MSKQIVVIGSANVDLIMKVAQLPTKGETVTGGSFHQVFGGKGANTAVGAARSGGKVSFVACVGNDASSPHMLADLEADGINTEFVVKATTQPSGHAVIMVDKIGNNCIAVAAGANCLLNEEHIDQAQAQILEAAIICLQFEIPATTTEYIIELAAKNHIPILWNFAPAQSFDQETRALVDYLIVNELEAGFLSGLEVDNQDAAVRAANQLRAQGHRVVVITLGSQGAIWVDQAGSYFQPAFPVAAIDTTAAGDIFCGSLATAIAAGNKKEEAMAFATAAAALSVTRLGAQPSAPSAEEIQDFLQQQT
ncbi:MAG: ribokinase [Bacteroidota bacterium]